MVFGEAKVDQALTKVDLRAIKSVEQRIELDVERLSEDLDVAMKEVTAAS